MALVTIWPHRFIGGWERGNPPETSKGKVPEQFPTVELLPALEARYDTFAHLVPYYVPGLAQIPRINQGGLAVLESAGSTIAFDSILIDLDAPPDVRAGGTPSVHAWCAYELMQVQTHIPELWTTCGWYGTRGGVRLLWLLQGGTDRQSYLKRLALVRYTLYQAGVQGIDELTDWGRCYQLPQVVRDGQRQEHPKDLSRLGTLPELPEPEGFALDFAGVEKANQSSGPGFELPEHIPQGQRDSTLYKYASQLRHQGRGLQEIADAVWLAYQARCDPGTDPLEPKDAARIARSACRFDPGAEPRTNVETIVVRAGALAALVDRSELLLAQSSIDAYSRAGELVAVREGADGRAGIQELQRNGLRVELNRLAEWTRYKYAYKEWTEIRIDPPLEIVDGLREKGAWPQLRELRGLTLTPTIRADGSLIVEPGYDRTSGVCFAPMRDEEWKTALSANGNVEPNQMRAKQAIQEIKDVLVDFPFQNPAHQSVVLACLLTALARNAIDGPAPLFLFDSTAPRSGKGLLAHTIAMIATGRSAGVSVQTRDEEAEKRVTSLLLAGEPIILLDNVEKPLGGAVLDAAITADEWIGRRLGQSEMVRVTNRSTWLATGNNVAVRGDLAKRCLRCYLAPDCENPDERTDFRYPELLANVKKRRISLVIAGLIVLRAWFLAGSPHYAVTPFGGFEAWAPVRHALIWAGEPDPCLTRREVVDGADTVIGALGTLLGAWRTVYGNKALTAQDLAAATGLMALIDGDESKKALHEALCELAGTDQGNISSRRVAWILRRYRGRIVNGLKLERMERGKRGFTWTVENTKENQNANS